MSQETIHTTNRAKDSILTITELCHLCMARWRWFVASVVVCFLLAVLYLIRTPFLYSRQATIMVLEESLGKNATDKNGNDFNDIGFVNQNSSVKNVMRHIQSLDILMEVARRLYPDLSEGDQLTKALEIQSRLSATSEEFGSTVIDLSYKDFSTVETTRVLTEILQVYNDKWLENKRRLAKNTSHFIDERLKLLERDLDEVDDSIAVFKARYGITDLERVGEIYLQQQNQSDAEILKLTNQKAMAEFLQEILENSSSQRQMLLVNSGISNSVIEAQITLYNSLLLELQSHLNYTSEQNPLVSHQVDELNNIRSRILASIKDYIETIDIQLDALIDFNDEATTKIVSNPSQAKYLTSIEREQKVKESLFVFLLQKMEENEISITYQSVNIQVLDMPHGSGKPTSPKRIQVLFASILLGVLIPVTVLFLRASFDESVRDRYDVERNSNIPFLGEVPYSGREHSLESLLMPLGIGRKAKTGGIVVGPDMLDASNEAFRVLRNNMDSVVAEKVQSKGGRVYLIKSTQIEVGKTFVGMNLALVKAVGGKHVLFIDADLRQASASRLWRTPLLGLTDYLQDEESDYRKLLWHPEGYPMLDVLPAGALPTNPTELLQESQFEQLLNTVRQDYDSIIIDSPTAGILADADTIERHIDCTLFIIRAGRFNRHRLGELSPIEIINGSCKPQYIILNGVSLNARYGNAYVHKYERSEKDKQTVEISKKTILLNKIIFKKKHHKS